ncbi:zinc ribbon domain-containing protein [Streptacidiphilus melanogenes]|uniref:zinc ribbon domain-containing protein n=1 Tax=Streptacidiphilus melanogenes TaxID=411235 RepID=UPI00191C5BC6|nr:C4-type zinc ribbon domain-containing protein [Streptacidiphilus melanogenes]
MNAAPADQIRLLDLQALDSRLDQLAHRRRTLPEHAEIEQRSTDLAQLRSLTVAAETQLSDTQRELTKAEQDVDQVRQRAARNQKLLDSGSVGSAKDLTNLQHEVGSLAKRQSDLEDVVLEIMERLESGQTRVSEMTARRDEAERSVKEAEERRDTSYGSIDAEVEKVTRDRETLSAAIPADLMKLYTRLRTQNAGIGAARLFQRRCEGCRVELSITDLGAVRAAAADEVVRCENCGRILVRTSESGL